MGSFRASKSEFPKIKSFNKSFEDAPPKNLVSEVHNK